MKVKVSNPDLAPDETTYLTADYSSGTTLTVRNSEGLTTSWYAVIGEPGQEQTEASAISALPTDTTVTISALKFAHPKSTPIYLSQWNQISFERKPSGGSYSVNQTVSIEWDESDKKSLIVVDGGQTSDTYRWRFYNSTLATYSDYSDELAGTGLTRFKVGYLIQQVRKNPIVQSVDDETIIGYFNDYQADVVYPEIPKAWWFSKEGTAVATVASAYTKDVYANWSDFSSMDLMLYRYVNGDTDITYPLTFSPKQEFYNLKSDSNQATDDYAKYWTLLPPDSTATKGYIAIHPTPKTTACYYKPVYFYELSSLDSFGDTVVVPFPKGYVDYALYRIADDIKNDDNLAGKFNARVSRGIVYLKRLARRQLGQPELFRFRGQRGWSRLYGEQSRLNSSESRELYF
jgi:hypothetical protein